MKIQLLGQNAKSRTVLKFSGRADFKTEDLMEISMKNKLEGFFVDMVYLFHLRKKN